MHSNWSNLTDGFFTHSPNRLFSIFLEPLICTEFNDIFTYLTHTFLFKLPVVINYNEKLIEFNHTFINK